MSLTSTTPTLDLAPLLGLNDEFPKVVFVLEHPSTNRFGCFCHEGTHGLACFSDESGAVRFGEFIDLTGLVTLALSFDEAREVAKDRPLPVTAVMLLDNMSSPVIHYVR